MAKPDILTEVASLAPAEAERRLKKHLRKRPRDVAAMQAYGDLLESQGRLSELADPLTNLARSMPSDADLLGRAIDANAAAGRHQQALLIALQACDQFSDNAKMWHRRGSAELALSNAAQAAKSFRIAHDLAPDDDAILAALADAELSSGAFPIPDTYARKILERAPDIASHHVRLGTAHRLNNHLEQAEACFRKAIDLDATLPSGHAGLAETLESLGRSQEAADQLRPLIEAGNPSFAAVLAWARIQQRLDDRPQAIKAMERYLASQRGLPMHRSKMCMQLGLAYEKDGRPEDAFRCWTQGNAMHQGRWNPEAHEKLVDSMMSTCTRDAMQHWPRAKNADYTPLLVVGMYRSGTTLTEHILSAHPDIEPGGESPAMPEAIRALAESLGDISNFPASMHAVTPEIIQHASDVYHSRLLDHADQGQFIVDKLPMNYLNLGLASLLLPNARVLHLVRDPLDTALSCYSQAFASQMSFTADMDHLGHAIAQQRRIMSHWSNTIDLPLLEVSYETLASEPDSTLRNIFEFIGIPWDDVVLRFHEVTRVAATPSMDQIRQPINTQAINRAAAFDAHLEPIKRALKN